jgi:UV DNA damage repair endonuclease
MSHFLIGTCCMIDENFSYRSITAKSFFKNRDYDNLISIWRSNLEKTREGLLFLASQDPHFHFFRLSSSLFPLATLNDEMWQIYLSYAGEMIARCRAIGDEVKALSPNFRIVTHPGQFCVLNSKTQKVIENSIREIRYHVLFMEAFGLPWSINVHLSGKDGDAKDRMIFTLKNDIDTYTVSHLSLENDEKSSSLDTVCEAAAETGCLVTFDVHHEAVNRTFKNLPYKLEICSDDKIQFIESGWKNNLGLTPAFHLSNRLEKDSVRGKACAHSNFFYEEDNKCILPLLERGWCLEAEAKAKLPAGKQLLADLLK